jgi:hypothetical protein
MAESKQCLICERSVFADRGINFAKARTCSGHCAAKLYRVENPGPTPPLPERIVGGKVES